MTTTEVVLTESRALRATMSGRTEALDKVKALVLLPDGLHVTRSMIAAYFEVDEEAINSIVRRHREELAENGYRLLQGADLQDFLVVNLTTRSVPGRGLSVFSRRAVLNVAMLLRDSGVARRVRTYLLDSEEVNRTRPYPSGYSLDDHVRETATQEAERYCAPFGEQLAQMRGLMEATNRVVCAMSVRLVDVQEDVAELRREVGAPSRQQRRRDRR